jgi:predicted aspartyl protease
LDLTWKCSKAYSPSAPVIRVELAETPLECLLDTGFSGGLLIPFPLFESLGFLSRLVADEYNAVLPDSRRFHLYTARDEVSIGDLRMTAEVHSSPAVAKKLVGRRLQRASVAKLGVERRWFPSPIPGRANGPFEVPLRLTAKEPTRMRPSMRQPPANRFVGYSPPTVPASSA